MAIQTKVALKSVFETDDIPTGDNFADLIDSFVGSVNGVQPDALGNIVVPDNSVAVQTALTNHQSVIGSENTPGHLAIQNFIGPNTQRAITPDAVRRLQETLQAEIDANETAIGTTNSNVTALTTRVTTVEGRVTDLQTAASTRLTNLETQVADLLTRVQALETP